MSKAKIQGATGEPSLVWGRRLRAIYPEMISKRES